jgi:hypothetical protein
VLSAIIVASTAAIQARRVMGSTSSFMVSAASTPAVARAFPRPRARSGGERRGEIAARLGHGRGVEEPGREGGAEPGGLGREAVDREAPRVLDRIEGVEAAGRAGADTRPPRLRQETGLRRVIEAAAAGMRKAAAIALLALLAGGVSMARAVRDPTFGEEIAEAWRGAARRLARGSAPAARL